METLEFTERLADTMARKEELYNDEKIYDLEALNASVGVGDPDKNTIICMEEMAELAKEISKCGRENPAASWHGTVRWYDLLQEMADVSIIITYLQIRYSISDDELAAAKSVKIKKLEKNLKEEGYLT